MCDIQTNSLSHLASHGCRISEKVKAIKISIKQRMFSDADLLSAPHPPLRSPSCTLPLMLSSKNTGTLSFLSMTHTSTVKLWVCMDFVKDTWEKALRSKHSKQHVLLELKRFCFTFLLASHFRQHLLFWAASRCLEHGFLHAKIIVSKV